MSDELHQDTELSTDDDQGGSRVERLGRRALMLGAATGAGVAVGLVAAADPAAAASPDGVPKVKLGTNNNATSTTSVTTTGGNGLQGSTSNTGQSGVVGFDTSSGGGHGVYATSTNGTGVYGQASAEFATGVEGLASGEYGNGVYGYSTGEYGYGVYGEGTGEYSTGVFAVALASSDALALFTKGNAEVNGTLSKSSGSFKIDHPLDPEGKYLYHSFVESPDMMNIYNGTVTLDGKGQATVELPDWFEALNRDFRYQLTALLGAAPNLHVSALVADGKFSIAGGNAGQEVSWQVTGIRQDAWANANRIPVEVEKKAEDQGRYLHPELFGKSDEHVITAMARARSHSRPRTSTVA